MLKKISLTVIATLLVSASSFALDRSPSANGTKLYFHSPQNGDTITGPVTVVFGLSKMGVSPAGFDKKHTGHHHLLINTDLPALDTPIPADDNHIHFGKGQTETTVELPPGKHTLQLLLGNYIHLPHDPVVASEVIEITVEPTKE